MHTWEEIFFFFFTRGWRLFVFNTPDNKRCFFHLFFFSQSASLFFPPPPPSLLSFFFFWTWSRGELAIYVLIFGSRRCKSFDMNNQGGILYINVCISKIRKKRRKKKKFFRIVKCQMHRCWCRRVCIGINTIVVCLVIVKCEKNGDYFETIRRNIPW